MPSPGFLIHSFTQALRYQLSPYPHVLEVAAVPPLVHTDMTAGRGSGKLSPGDAADAIVTGLDRGDRDIYVGKAKLLRRPHRVAPRLVEGMLRRGQERLTAAGEGWRPVTALETRLRPHGGVRMRTLRMVWIVALGVGPGSALADSDGYYCQGPGYLAYETRVSTPATNHELHVVRYSQREGIVRLPPIVLDEFQVHGMRCGRSEVELTSGNTTYRVDLADPRHPVVTAEPAPPGAGHDQAANLAHWSSAGVVDLASDAPAGEFQLVVSRVSRSTDAGVEHYTISRVIRRDPTPGGYVRASETVFEGIFLETVD